MRGTKHLLDRLDAINDAIQYGSPQEIAKAVSDQTTRAMNGFAMAEYDGINDVTVDMETGNNTWSINAIGTAVLFIEYGTGVTYSHTSQFGGQTYAPASWSASHDRWLVNPKLAKYGGKWPIPGWRHYWTKGNKSANVMYETGKALEQILPSTVRLTIRKAMS